MERPPAAQAAWKRPARPSRSRMREFLESIIELLLAEDLQRELGRATALDELGRLVEIDVVARGQLDRSLGRVPGALQRFGAPALDSSKLSALRGLNVSRRHRLLRSIRNSHSLKREKRISPYRVIRSFTEF
jgi:hypothetical protein